MPQSLQENSAKIISKVVHLACKQICISQYMDYMYIIVSCICFLSDPTFAILKYIFWAF